MNYIIFDLEATCWETEDKKFQKDNSEIIEIGAVKLNSKFELIDEFQTFIKPVLNPTLSDFCKTLTSIKQEDVDNALNFPLAYVNFFNWVEKNVDDYLLVSWGYYDINQLARDLVKFDMSYERLENKHFNFSRFYAHLMNKGKKVGISKALEQQNLSFEGTHHRGIDDSKNIAKLFRNVCLNNELKVVYSQIKL